MDLKLTWKGKTTTSSVYLRSDKEEGEPLLLGTNAIIPLGLMRPATGVEALVSKGQGVEGGVVRLLKAVRIPRGSGMVVEVWVDRRPGETNAMLVEPMADCCGGLSMEEMVVDVKEEGQALVVVTNTSHEALVVEAGLEIGLASSLLWGKRRCV